MGALYKNHNEVLSSAKNAVSVSTKVYAYCEPGLFKMLAWFLDNAEHHP